MEFIFTEKYFIDFSCFFSITLLLRLTRLIIFIFNMTSAESMFTCYTNHLKVLNNACPFPCHLVALRAPFLSSSSLTLLPSSDLEKMGPSMDFCCFLSISLGTLCKPCLHSLLIILYLILPSFPSLSSPLRQCKPTTFK